MMRNLKSLYTPRAISARIVNTVFCLFEWALERTLKKVKHRISHFQDCSNYIFAVFYCSQVFFRVQSSPTIIVPILNLQNYDASDTDGDFDDDDND